MSYTASPAAQSDPAGLEQPFRNEKGLVQVLERSFLDGKGLVRILGEPFRDEKGLV